MKDTEYLVAVLVEVATMVYVDVTEDHTVRAYCRAERAPVSSPSTERTSSGSSPMEAPSPRSSPGSPGTCSLRRARRRFLPLQAVVATAVAQVSEMVVVEVVKETCVHVE